MLPDADTVASMIQDVVQNDEIASGELAKTVGGVAATGLDPTGTTLFAVGSLVATSIAQEKAVEWGGMVDSRLSEFIDDADTEEDKHKRALIGAIRAFLPDSESWDEVAVEAAGGNPDRMLSLIETYQNDPEKRKELEEAREELVAGNVDELVDDDEDFVDYLQRKLETDDRSEALAMYLDLQDLLMADDIQETLATVLDIEQQTEAIKEEVSKARAELQEALDRELRNQGFKHVDEAYYRLHEPKSLSEAWRTGIRPVDVRAGHGIDRNVQPHNAAMEDGKPEQFAPDEMHERLTQSSSDATLVLGKPGSGKSTYCRLVIDRWQLESQGPVFYRRSGGPAFDSPGTLRSAIEKADGHALVVVDDAARPETRRIYEVAHDLADRQDVSFLFNARYSEFGSFDPAPSPESDLALELRDFMGQLDKFEVSKLTANQCLAILEHFEAETDSQTGFDAAELVKQLYDDESTKDGTEAAGSMLQLVYRLLTGAEGLTGLESDIRDKVETVESAEGDTKIARELANINPELRQTGGLMINVLNAAPDVEVRPTYLAGLAACIDDVTVSDVADFLSTLDGWLVFKSEGQLECMHEFWSFLYLRYTAAGVNSSDLGHGSAPVDATAAHQRFATCVRALQAVFTNEIDEDDIFFAMETARIDETDLSESTFGDTILPALYDIGVNRPILTPLYQFKGRSRLALEEMPGCSDATAVRIRAKLGRMLRKQGSHDHAEQQFETAGQVLDEIETAAEKRAEAYRLNQAAAVYRVIGDYETAEKLSKKSLQLARDIEAPKQEIRARNYLAIIHRNRRERQQQWEQYQQSLELARLHGFTDLEASTLNNLGWMHWGSDDEASKERHQRALELSRAVSARDQEARALRSLGNIANDEGKGAEAEEYLKRALGIYREIGEREAEGWVLLGLGNVYEGRGDRTAAREAYDQSQSIFNSLNLKRGQRETATALDRMKE